MTLKAINIDEAILTWQRAEAAAIAAQLDPSEQQPRLEGASLEVRALSYRVEEDLKAHLTQLGLPPEVLTTALGYTGQAGPGMDHRCEG